MNFNSEVNQAFESANWTKTQCAKRVWGYEENDDLFVEVDYKPINNGKSFGMFQGINATTALAAHFTDEFDGSVNLAVHKDENLCRLTVGSDHAEMNNDELRQRVAQSVRFE